MRYYVQHRESRTQKWSTKGTSRIETLEDAIEIANAIWRNNIDENAYIDVRIGRYNYD